MFVCGWLCCGWVVAEVAGYSGFPMDFFFFFPSVVTLGFFFFFFSMGFCSSGILVSSGQWAVVAWVFLGFCSDGSVCGFVC